MEQALTQMEAHHAAAHEQPPEAAVDEPNPREGRASALAHPSQQYFAPV
jgi:hypothetical protein